MCDKTRSEIYPSGEKAMETSESADYKICICQQEKSDIDTSHEFVITCPR